MFPSFLLSLPFLSPFSPLPFFLSASKKWTDYFPSNILLLIRLTPILLPLSFPLFREYSSPLSTSFSQFLPFPLLYSLLPPLLPRLLLPPPLPSTSSTATCLPSSPKQNLTLGTSCLVAILPMVPKTRQGGMGMGKWRSTYFPFIHFQLNGI